MRVRRRSPIERFLPVGYVGAAVILASILLPTALRPPQDLQNASTAFSPDAPPDDAPQEALLQSLRQASSSTAGGGLGNNQQIDQGQVDPKTGKSVQTIVRKPSKGKCFGDPPRQTESLYSALCVPAWTGGDNGGDTWKGVTANQILVAVATGLSSTVPEGVLPLEFDTADSTDTHTYKVYQKYFNERFEFYGRTLRFFIVHQSADDEDLQRASVNTVNDQGPVFAMTGNGAAAVNEAIRLKIVDFGSANNPVAFYDDNFPYAFAFYEDSWVTRFMAVELACKQFVGKPPGLLNNKQDLTFDYNAPRKWGLITYQDPTRTGATAMYTELMKRCPNLPERDKDKPFFLTAEYNLTDNEQSIAGTVSKMRAAGATTLIIGVDGVTPAVLTNEAEKQGYYPEWVEPGTGGIDTPAAGRLMDDNQATHVVGLAPLEIPRLNADKDWYRTYKEIDPEGTPDSNFAVFFRNMQQLSGGMQACGPKLTPTCLWEGLSTQPYRAPVPAWTMGGGYREAADFQPVGSGIDGKPRRDLTYIDYMSLIWFDNKGDDPNSDLTGTWRYVWGGKRFKYGELPTDPIPWFQMDGSITTPEKGVSG